jgi:BASS family bile acid:Na+ symporter
LLKNAPHQMINLLFEHIDFLIDLVLAFITMSLGLNLSKTDFKNIVAFPGPLSIGLIAQMVLLPLSALVLMLLSDFNPEVKVGFIIIALCPGGVTSNLVSYLLKGNVALSISLTFVNGILCMFSLPILVNLALNYFINQTHLIELPVIKTIEHIALVTVLPAAVGLMIRNRLPKIADTLRPILKYLLPSLLLFIFLTKMFAPVEKGGIALTQAELVEQGIWVLLLNFSGMFLGYLLGTAFQTNLQNKVTIMVEVGLQNTALALLIAGNILHNDNMQKPAMVYAILTFFSTLFFAWIIKNISLKFVDKAA